MTYQAGSASVSIVPEFEDFHSKIREELTALDAQFAEAGDKSGKSFAGTFQAQLKASFANLPNAKITADADTTKAKSELDDAARPRTAKIKVDVDKSSLVKLQNPLSGISPLVGAGIAGGIALGPQALGLGLGLAGLGAAFGAAAAGAGAFGAVAKPMFTDVTKAQKALTTAQDAYNKATTDRARAQALKDEQAALAGLTPAERQLATELTGLESAWKGLQLAEQPVVGQAIAPWLATATGGMSLLKPVIGDAAEAIGILGSQAQSAFTAPFWGTFFSTLGNTGRIAIEDFGHAAGLLGDGLAHLFVTFAPDIDKLPPLVDKAAAAFDKWAKSVNSSGLDSFFKTTFSPANVAALKTDLGNVATIVENIAKAGAQLSPTAFSGVSNLLDVAAKLSPGQIEALAGLFVAGKAVGGFGNAAKLLTGGAGLSLPGKKAAGTEEEAAKAGSATKLTKAGKVAGAAAGVVPVLGAASVIDQAIPKGPGGEWVNSWAPYEKIFTNDLPKAWSISYEAFQVEFAGPMTSWFTSSLPHFFTSTIPANVWSPAYEGFQRDFAGPMTAWFTSSLPHFFTSSVPGAWSWAYQGFEQNVGSPVAAWFANSVPHFFTSGVPAAWSWAYQGFETNVGSPVAAWFTSSVPHFFTSAVPAAWSWAYTGFISAVGTPVSNWFSQSVPHFFTSAVPSAWSWAWTHFSSAVGTPVSNWFTSSLPSFVTRSIPNAFSSLWSSFISAVVSPVTNFFTSTLPGLAGSALSTAKGILGTAAGALGFASGTPSAPPGWAWVGEQGPELMHFAGGEQVLPHAQSLASAQALAGAANAQSLSALGSLGVPSLGGAARLPGVSSPLGGGQLQMAVTYAGPSTGAIAAIVQDLQFHIQGTTGGDVQAALGRGAVRT